MGARGCAAERHRARARALAPAPRDRAGDARRARHAAARLPRAGVDRRRGDPRPRRPPAPALDANAAQVAAELAEPGLLPDLDAPWLGGAARRPRGAADRGAGDWSPARAARGGDAADAERAARAAIAARAVPRVRARGADRGPDAAREHRRGDARLRRDPRAAARGARHRRRARAGRAARAAARPAGPVARREQPTGCSSATPSWPRSPPRSRGCAPARAGCSRSRARPGSARRACSACCASARSRRARRCSTRGGRARARVRLRRRAPALRGGRGHGPAAGRRPLGLRRGRGARRPVRGAQRAVPATRRRSPRGARWCCASTTCSGATPPRCASSPTWRAASATLPVLVATTIRTGEPDSDELLLGEIGQDPATVAVQPRPLTEDGTAGMVSDAARRRRRRVRRRLPGGHRRQPAAAAPAADRARGRAGRAGRRARRVGARDRPARGVAHRAAAARAAAGARRRPSRAPSRCSASSPACRRSPRWPGVTRRRRRRRSTRWCAPRSCAPTSRWVRAPAGARRGLLRAAGRAARARARAGGAAAG